MNDFSKDIEAILNDYSDEVSAVIEQASKVAAQATVKELKATAPRDKGRTGYSRSFAIKKSGTGRNTSYTAYSKVPNMTHLLEKGHAIANQYGRYGGRTNGKKHWAPAERIGIERFEKEIRDELGE